MFERLKKHVWKACVPKRYRGFKSHSLRFIFFVLTQGDKLFSAKCGGHSRFFIQIGLRVESCAADTYEPRQALTGATVSNAIRVPQGRSALAHLSGFNWKQGTIFYYAREWFRRRNSLINPYGGIEFSCSKEP